MGVHYDVNILRICKGKDHNIYFMCLDNNQNVVVAKYVPDSANIKTFITPSKWGLASVNTSVINNPLVDANGHMYIAISEYASNKVAV